MGEFFTPSICEKLIEEAGVWKERGYNKPAKVDYNILADALNACVMRSFFDRTSWLKGQKLTSKLDVLIKSKLESTEMVARDCIDYSNDPTLLLKERAEFSEAALHMRSRLAELKAAHDALQIVSRCFRIQKAPLWNELASILANAFSEAVRHPKQGRTYKLSKDGPTIRFVEAGLIAVGGRNRRSRSGIESALRRNEKRL